TTADEKGKGLRPGIHASPEIRQVAVRPTPAPILQQRLPEFFAERGDRLESDPDGLVLHGEDILGTIDAGKANADAGTLDPLDVDPARIHALVVVEGRRPETQRDVRFEGRSFPGDEAVADRVTLAKGVVVELGQLHPQLSCHGSWDLVARAGLQE